MRGRVKYFDTHRGFGFIIVEGAADVFVHVRDVHLPEGQYLTKDQEVEFGLGISKDQRQHATNVRVVGDLVPTAPALPDRARRHISEAIETLSLKGDGRRERRADAEEVFRRRIRQGC